MALALVIAACGSKGASSNPSSSRPGQAGATYLVTVWRPTGGTVTSSDLQIECGTAPTASKCGPVSYPWGQAVTLTAAPDAGFMFGTWGGDCIGRGPCVLSTAQYGADKYVVAVFGEDGLTQHENFIDPALHGPEFFKWIQKKPHSFDCAACHGGTYAGLGIAPSCNACHERAGYPNWLTNCNFCHLSPPTTQSAGGIHPDVSDPIGSCTVCHPTTVDESRNIIAGGTHMNGVIDASGGGHPAGYRAVDQHAPDFFKYLSGQGGVNCSGCHGATYGRDVGGGVSCNGCHAAEGWTNWSANCSFCHGYVDATTKQGGYVVADHPTWTAPPASVPERVFKTLAPERTGAHRAHLTASTVAGAFKCETCHAVPTSIAHVNGGADLRATVVLQGAGQGHLPTNLGTYDPASRTCTTTCHKGTSPAWSFTGMQCDGCHGTPPATPSHSGVTSLARCVECHPDTMTASGAVNVDGGKHLDGVVEANIVDHTATFSNPAEHGLKFFAYLSGTGGSDCTSCHGQDYGAPIVSGQSCNTCHGFAGWTNWVTNCSFCHGQHTADTQRGYDVAASPMFAAPPDAISERLGIAPAPDRTGAHAAHLTAGPYANAFKCETCHAVPSTVAHVNSSDLRATVVLSGAGQGELAADLGTYSKTARTCATYCHGANGSPLWSATGLQCNGCHATPPATSAHAKVTGMGDCITCHPDTVNADGTIHVASGTHLNGKVDSVGHDAGFAAVSVHGPQALAHFANDPNAMNCAACHAGYASCTTCHSSIEGGSWVEWQSNCTFCHGAKTKSYTFASNPSLSAPPDSVAFRTDPNAAQDLPIGKHAKHLATYRCETCHAVPTDLSHIQNKGRADVVLSGAGAFPSVVNPPNLGTFNPANNQCSTYCHGTTLVGGTNVAPVWSQTSASMNCTSCHGNPPPTGGPYQDSYYCRTPCSLHDLHVTAVACTDCHPTSWKMNHANGVLEFQPQVGWNPSDGTCSSSAYGCHGNTRTW